MLRHSRQRHGQKINKAYQPHHYHHLHRHHPITDTTTITPTTTIIDATTTTTFGGKTTTTTLRIFHATAARVSHTAAFQVSTPFQLYGIRAHLLWDVPSFIWISIRLIMYVIVVFNAYMNSVICKIQQRLHFQERRFSW